MKNYSEPFILTDKTKLTEIYKLRVSAFEVSEKSEIINFDKYPDGWQDELDDTGIHFVSMNEENKIIAAARTNFITKLSDLPYPEVFKSFILPSDRPFLYYSRLVIDNEFRCIKLLKAILDLEYKFLISNSKFGITLASKTTNLLIRFYNFKNLGPVDTSYYPYGNDNLLLLINPNGKGHDIDNNNEK